MFKKKISIISSCYNEEGNLWELYGRTTAVMDQFPQYEFEFILAENGSTDNTQEALRAIAEKDKRFKIVINSRCFKASRSGYNIWRAATGDCIVSMVSDLQDPPELIADFIRKWEDGYKIVIAVKNKSKENPLMYRIRKFYYKLIRTISETEMIDNFTGFGLYDKKIYEILRARDWPVPYMRGLISEVGFERAVICFTQEKRKYGKSSTNFFKLYDTAMNGITSFSKLPLRIATLVGGLLSAGSMAAALIYLIIKLIYWDRMPVGIAPLIVGAFFLLSMQILFIGLVGEYVVQILEHVDKKPLVVEKERINFDDN